MANTAGFEVIAQVTKGVLQQILEGAWDNSIIPHSFDISPDLMFGPYQVADGVVNIPRSGLVLDMAPADNGVRITLPSTIQVEIANPPVPSIRLFNMGADIFVTAPIGTLPGTINVGVILQGLPRNMVNATLTSGDPIGPITLSLIQEYVHHKYADGTIPHTFTQNSVNWGIFSTDVYVEIYDDPSNPMDQIIVSQPASNQVKLLIPIYLRLSNIHASVGLSPLSPMGVKAKITITAPLETASDSIKATLTLATVDVENLVPAPGIEGSNYTFNKTAAGYIGIDLENLFKNEIKARGHDIIRNIGDIQIFKPTISDIEKFIGDQAHAELINRGNISVWTPDAPEGGEVTVHDVTTRALADALTICINDMGGADPNAITNLIPVDRSCAIVVNGNKILQIIDETIHRPESEGGFGPDFPPKTFDNVNGHKARLNSLSISLIDGAINMKGDVTVIDAVCGIDVDASFEANAGLRWEDNPDGTQSIKPYLIGEPDVDVSWIISFLIGFITLGLVGGIVVLVVYFIVEGIAERIGGGIIRDQVTNQIKSIGAWPQRLEGIGTVTTRFENPIDIDPDGIIFPDAYLVTATYALTVDAMAKANGPYVVNGGSPLQFIGGPMTPDTDYLWDFGDGNTATGAIVSHTYADDGIYVAKLTTNVNQPGGSCTREFALIRVRNVPPRVEVGPDVIVDEGHKIEYIATFMDPEWLDTHKAIFDFGDDSLPVEAIVSETNNSPQAQGTARAKHAYCTDGKYTVTVRVFDDDGGIGIGTFQVRVRNVAPTVDAGEDVFAYICTPITLVAHFTDPGWCDKHKGFWNFGDCTPPHPATIRETNKPPAGTGIASAIHIYNRCSTYLAECTVIDEEGGTGRDTIIVRVVDVLNRDFESGFRIRSEGTVANGWEPYAIKEKTEGVPIFSAEEFIVHSGQRSQKISGSGKFSAGIYQRVGTNIDWDYQVSAWYHQQGGGKCRLGIDPTGDTDSTSSNIVWIEGDENRNWAQLAERVTAKSRAITIYLEAQSDSRGTTAYFDDVTLIAYPCVLREKAPPPPKSEEKCVNWKEEKERSEVGVEYQKNGFTFKSQKPLQIVVWGIPADQGKLAIPRFDLLVQLPFVADRVLAHLVLYTQEPLTMNALNGTGKTIGQVVTTATQSKIHMLEVKAADISALLITGGGNESLLIDLCAYRLVEIREDEVKKIKE